jgi:AcrR family transcriptional regulator
MVAPTGRREANKQATRIALLEAARQLFARQGFEATTVRDIAQAANVTERTFYRYFDGKEGLVAGEYLSWLATLQAAIIGRPAQEPPFVAVQRAMASLSQQAAAGRGLLPRWPFGDGPPGVRLRQSGLRPMLRFEDSIADAILSRLRAARAAEPGQPAEAAEPGRAGQDEPDDTFSAQVMGRICVAAFRSARIRYRQLQAAGEAVPNTLQLLLDQAFAIVSHAPSRP